VRCVSVGIIFGQAWCHYLMVEQKVSEVMKIVEWVYVLRDSCDSFVVSIEGLKDERKLREVCLWSVSA
jgi:hypothetical protein